MAGFLGGWNTGSGGLLNAQQPVSGLLGVQQALAPLSNANDAFQQQQFHNLAQLPPQFRVSPQDWGTLMALGGPIAYHGSPYSFDAFDASKIGTGEGAQAYGHGLYFAENPGVAADYRDRLSSSGAPDWDKDPEKMRIVINGQPQKLTDPAQIRAWRTLDSTGGHAPDQFPNAYPRAMTYRKNDPEAQGWLQQWQAAGARTQKGEGSLYKVDIQPDPEQFLDWDKPLSEQPEAIRSAFAKAHISGSDPVLSELLGSGPVPNEYLGLFPGSKGSQAYNTLAEKLGGHPQASAALQQAGIPGIRYLDQGSRGAGAGTHNYVVFDPSHVNILERNGQPLK